MHRQVRFVDTLYKARFRCANASTVGLRFLNCARRAERRAAAAGDDDDSFYAVLEKSNPTFGMHACILKMPPFDLTCDQVSSFWIARNGGGSGGSRHMFLGL